MNLTEKEVHWYRNDGSKLTPRRKALNRADEFDNRGQNERAKKIRSIVISKDHGDTYDARRKAKNIKVDDNKVGKLPVAAKSDKRGAIDVKHNLKKLKEEAPPTKKHERMVKHIKKAYKKDGKLTDDEKSIAYATAWKNYNKKEVKEAKTIRSKEDAEKARQKRDNPDEWVVRNKGGGHHGLNRKSALKGQAKRRSGNLPPLKQKELEDHGKRNLHPDYKKTARKAIKIERERKKTQRSEAQSKSKETGKQHDVDHIQGQSNRKKHSDRWHKIHPGDASDNRRVISQSDNLKKNSKDTGGKKITRSSAIKRALSRVRKESFEIDKAAHKAAQKKTKMRNLAKGNTNPHEKAAAEKKAGGPKLYGEEVSRRNKPSSIAKKKKLEKLLIDKEVNKVQKEETTMTYQEMIDAGWEMTGEGIWWPPQDTETVTEKLTFPKFRKKAAKRKPQMDDTTKKLHQWRKDKEQEEREKYVTFTKPIEKD